MLFARVGATEKAYGKDPVDRFARDIVKEIYFASSSPTGVFPNGLKVVFACKKNLAGKITCGKVPTSLFGDSLQVFPPSQEQSLLILWLILGITWGVMINDMLRLIESRYRYSENSLSVADGLPELLLGANVVRAVKGLVKQSPFCRQPSALTVTLVMAMLLKWTLVGVVGGLSASLICRLRLTHLMNPTQEVSMVVEMTHDY